MNADSDAVDYLKNKFEVLNGRYMLRWASPSWLDMRDHLSGSLLGRGDRVAADLEWRHMCNNVTSDINTSTCSSRVPDLRKLKLVLPESRWRLSEESRLLQRLWDLRGAGSWHWGPDTAHRDMSLAHWQWESEGWIKCSWHWKDKEILCMEPVLS